MMCLYFQMVWFICFKLSCLSWKSVIFPKSKIKLLKNFCFILNILVIDICYAKLAERGFNTVLRVELIIHVTKLFCENHFKEIWLLYFQMVWFICFKLSCLSWKSVIFLKPKRKLFKNFCFILIILVIDICYAKLADRDFNTFLRAELIELLICPPLSWQF